MPNTVSRRSWIGYALAFMASLFYTPVTYRTLAGLGCSTFDDGISRLDHEIATKCYDGSHWFAAVFLFWPIVVVYVAGLPLATLVRGIGVYRTGRAIASKLPADAMRYNIFLVRGAFRFLFTGYFTSYSCAGAVPFFLVLAISAVAAMVKDNLSLEVIATALATSIALGLTAWTAISRWRAAASAVSAVAIILVILIVTVNDASPAAVSISVIALVLAVLIAIRIAYSRTSQTESSRPQSDPATYDSAHPHGRPAAR